MQGAADLWLPGEFYAREEFELERAAADMAMAEAFRNQLKTIDDRLDLVWAKEGSTSFGPDCHWYIVRLNDGAPPTCWMVGDENGGYKTPDESDLEELRAKDMWAHPESWRDYRRRQEAAGAAAARARQRDLEDRNDLALEIANHHLDARIAVTAEQRAKLGDLAEAEEPAAA